MNDNDAGRSVVIAGSDPQSHAKQNQKQIAGRDEVHARNDDYGKGNGTATAKWKTALRDSALALRSTQNDRGRDSAHSRRMTGGRHFSFWIATGGQSAPRNDDHGYGNGTATAKRKTALRDSALALRSTQNDRRRASPHLISFFSQRGQSLVEAVFTVLFLTIIMFAFIQVCVIVVDDMTANEAAFVAVRSAVVTESRFRAEDSQKWAKKHFLLFYPFNGIDVLGRTSFGLSDKDTVEKYFGQNSDDESLDERAQNSDSNAITIWDGEKKTKDYSGKSLSKKTVKIYYFTKVMFGALTAPKNSKKYWGQSGRRRYQSARARMFPSPDEDFYYKAYPDGERFKDFSLSDSKE
jgi:hypothetical protein